MKVLWHVLGMLVLGAIALAIPAWLGEVRMDKPVQIPAPIVSQVTEQSRGPQAGTISERVGTGLLMSMLTAERHLNEGQRSEANHALDAAHRVAVVGAHALPARKSRYEEVRKALERTRHKLQNGSPEEAADVLSSAIRHWTGRTDGPDDTQVKTADRPAYRGAVVLDMHGARIGEVVDVRGERMTIALGGLRDVLGFLDITPGTRIEIPVTQALAGPAGPFKGAQVLVVTRDDGRRPGA